MRKALIAVIVASALFAVGAFAAEIVTVSPDDIASGEGAVESCASEARVTEYATDGDAVVTGGGTGADYGVNQAKVQLIEASGKSCDGALVDLALGSDTDDNTTTDTWHDFTCGAAVAGIYTCTSDDGVGTRALARQVIEVSVLANGNSVSALAP